MSITAFPVLARILTERGLNGTELGNLAIGCAAIDDVTAWCLLALVLAVEPGDTGSSSRWWPSLLAGIVAVIALAVVRPRAAAAFWRIGFGLDESADAAQCRAVSVWRPRFRRRRSVCTRSSARSSPGLRWAVPQDLREPLATRDRAADFDAAAAVVLCLLRPAHRSGLIVGTGMDRVRPGPRWPRWPESLARSRRQRGSRERRGANRSRSGR